jgi:hypothetical protein
MANLFDASNAPEREPLTVTVGDYIQWKRSDLVQDYPTATHSAAYVARITGGGVNEIQIAATEANPDFYLFTASSAQSADFRPGYYHWQLEITQTATGNRIVVDTGNLTIAPDLDVNNSDPRSHAEIMLDKIEGLLQGRADSDVASYSIQGRSLAKMSVADLIEWRNYYRREVKQEQRNSDIQNGRQTSTSVKVRFL